MPINIMYNKVIECASAVGNYITTNYSNSSKNVYILWLPSFHLDQTYNIEQMKNTVKDLPNLYVVVVNCSSFRSHYPHPIASFEKILNRNVNGCAIVSYFEGQIKYGLADIDTMMS